jgi:hypothetical protein
VGIDTSVGGGRVEAADGHGGSGADKRALEVVRGDGNVSGNKRDILRQNTLKIVDIDIVEASTGKFVQTITVVYRGGCLQDCHPGG